MPNQYTYISIAERFWAKVDKSKGPQACWLWLNHLTRKGYGLFYYKERLIPAHHFPLLLRDIIIPAGFQTDHLCRVRHCVNPLHLEIVTSRENTLRGEGPAAVNARKLICLRGHAFNSLNSYINVNGSRECRPCRRERALMCRLKAAHELAKAGAEQAVLF